MTKFISRSLLFLLMASIPLMGYTQYSDKLIEELIQARTQKEQPKSFKWSQCLAALSKANTERANKEQETRTRRLEELLAIDANIVELEKELPEKLRSIKGDYDDRRREMELQLVSLKGRRRQANIDLATAQDTIRIQCEAEAQEYYQGQLSTIQSGVSQNTLDNASSELTNINSSFGEQKVRCLNNEPTLRALLRANQSYQNTVETLREEEESIITHSKELKRQAIQDQNLAEHANNIAKAFKERELKIVEITARTALGNINATKRSQDFLSSLNCIEDFSDKLKEINSYEDAEKRREEAIQNNGR